MENKIYGSTYAAFCDLLRSGMRIHFPFRSEKLGRSLQKRIYLYCVCISCVHKMLSFQSNSNRICFTNAKWHGHSFFVVNRSFALVTQRWICSNFSLIFSSLTSFCWFCVSKFYIYFTTAIRKQDTNRRTGRRITFWLAIVLYTVSLHYQHTKWHYFVSEHIPHRFRPTNSDSHKLFVVCERLNKNFRLQGRQVITHLHFSLVILNIR